MASRLCVCSSRAFSNQVKEQEGHLQRIPATLRYQLVVWLGTGVR